ncbi:Signal recognition particle subunit SRP72 [Exophiala xenobiotica]|uniref:Signal recognition particle subunit SRP72 n=1 Tax=Lithohypha guttulata TaxID=1690604 RepID=A0ABR0KHH0_9EURO|nr:Signal recognition particle subunit SRP72 [Lithohypha guttulata]KAK5323672.1 Signal recognition particle subunit SRP72 [Exophiala xenobiotica]
MSNNLTSLLKKSTLDDHDALLQAADGALKSSPNDTQAQQIRAIALLKLERYSDALAYFGHVKDLRESLPEAYSYCLYRSGKFEEAVAAASSVQNSRGAQHIKLQAAYRAEDWDAASQAYDTLSASNVPKEDFDLRVNKLAIDAEGLWLEKFAKSAVPRAKPDDLAAFETAYNAACISVSKGQLEEADRLLKRAVSLCEHHEELSDEDKTVELVPLKAQRIFILQRLGKAEEAATLAKEVQASLEGAALDARTRRLAESNTLSVSGDIENPFLLHKLFNQSSVPRGERFFTNQTASLASNERTVQMQSFKYDGLINAARKKLKGDALPSTSSDILLTSMFEAAALARGEVSKAAINKALPELEKRPNDVGLVMTIVQLYVLTGNATAAVDTLHAFFVRLEKSASEKDEEVRYSPGLVGLMVSLYRSQNRRSQVRQELAKSATYWRTKSNAPSSLLRAAGVALLESSNSEDVQAASDIFDKLYSQEPNDRATIAGYVASHASAPDSNIKSLADKLKPTSDLTSTIDVDALETAGISQSANALAIAQAGTSRKRKALDGTTSKPKRIRKSRLPKDYDPNKKPDPERWLPLRDRSTYRPKKRKGKRDDRTQGGGNVNESLDISNRPAGGASEVVTANQGGGKNKRKGKGKK